MWCRIQTHPYHRSGGARGDHQGDKNPPRVDRALARGNQPGGAGDYLPPPPPQDHRTLFPSSTGESRRPTPLPGPWRGPVGVSGHNLMLDGARSTAPASLELRGDRPGGGTTPLLPRVNRALTGGGINRGLPPGITAPSLQLNRGTTGGGHPPPPGALATPFVGGKGGSPGDLGQGSYLSPAHLPQDRPHPSRYSEGGENSLAVSGARLPPSIARL